MRNKFAEIIYDLSKKEKKIVLLSGDIGNKMFDKFKKKFSNRFFNCGIAEANMTTVASALAKEGFKPFTYTIASFNVLKTIEQIKIDICYPKLPVIIVGTGSGLSYSSLGATHHSLEDLGILKNIPNLNIFSPIDGNTLKKSILSSLKSKGPCYIRIGKKETWLLNPRKYNLYQKKNFLFPLKKKPKIIIVTHGVIAKNVFEAVSDLNKKKIFPSIYCNYNLTNIKKKELKLIFSKFNKIFFVEEHFLKGGLASHFFEKSLEYKLDFDTKKIISINPKFKFMKGLGEKEEALIKLGLNKDKIIKRIITSLN